MCKKILVSPSILSANFSELGLEVARLEKAGVDMVHLDVMDGQFVKNITFGAPVIKSIRKKTNLIFDAHLMIKNPFDYIEDFAKAGCDIITFHVEADCDIKKTIELIKSFGKKAGLAIKPATDIKMVEQYINDIDMVLVMTVEPGFGGQSFMQDMMPKVEYVRDIIAKTNSELLLSVDGGIDDNTIGIAKQAGVNTVVSGSYVFSKSDYAQAVEKLKL